MRFACGDTKLLCITFCTHINEAEDLMADVGLHNEATTTKLKAIMFCKIIHKTEADVGTESPAVEVDVHSEYKHWNKEEVERLIESYRGH